MELLELISDLHYFEHIGSYKNADLTFKYLTTSSRKDKEGNRLFIALPFPLALREKLSHISNLEDDLHITILYLKDQVYTQKDRDCAIDALEAVTRKYGPLKCAIQGIGMMGEDNSLIVNINIERGAEFYVDLLREVENRMGPVNRNYDFIPHMTLKYKNPEQKISAEDLKKIRWTQYEVLINFSRQGKQKRLRFKG